MDASTARKVLSTEECERRWRAYQMLPGRENLIQSICGFYSSLLGGITQDPLYFQIPIDDHGFHRGDGVFEAIRVAHRKPYLLTSHLDRLDRSAAHVGLKLPYTRGEMQSILFDLARLAEEESLILRLYLTRGGGGFGVSPQESAGAQFYAVATKFQVPAAAVWAQGVSLATSQVPVKAGQFSKIKSLNYLPNVLMKAEALKRGFDFAVGFDEQGFVTEGATENIVIVNHAGELCHPRFEKILDGCTLRRVFELAPQLTGLRLKPEVDLTLEDLKRAQEILLIGTTLDVTPVTRFEERVLIRGPWSEKLRDLIRTDQLRS